MNLAMRRTVLLPGLLQQAWGALGSSWRRPLCVSAQKTLSSSENPISDKSSKELGLFPPMPGEQSSLRWRGLKYEEVPVVHIKATYNNTHIQVMQPDNKYITRTSCGTEGFRNAKKSSSVAAQTAGLSAATKAVDKGVVHVRVVVKACHQRVNHGRTGSDIHYRQHPHPSQWLPSTQSAQIVNKIAVGKMRPTVIPTERSTRKKQQFAP
ncbi:small ribosomal subunit protein uS11m isoform X1 [Phyllobates terribilis]|uniref:small ribosomal subunit protein uS11m isoform X1 n=1 Tax=Phyllobates terribilis TaxID=111132 RepID=UPI003CCB0705